MSCGLSNTAQVSQEIGNNLSMDFQITETHMVTNALVIWEEYTAFGAGSSKWIRLYTLKFPFAADCKSICIVILIFTWDKNSVME